MSFRPPSEPAGSRAARASSLHVNHRLSQVLKIGLKFAPRREDTVPTEVKRNADGTYTLSEKEMYDLVQNEVVPQYLKDEYESLTIVSPAPGPTTRRIAVEESSSDEEEEFVSLKRRAEEARKRKAKEEQARRRAEAEEARRRAEEEARRQAEEEAARMRAEAEEECKRKAEEEKEEDLEVVEEEVGDSTITTTDAYETFAITWEEVANSAMERVAKMTDEEANRVFPILRENKEGFAMKVPGPIRIVVWRMKKKEPSDLQKKELTRCGDKDGVSMLMQQETFYFYEPDALFSGGSGFRHLWYTQPPFQAYIVDPKAPNYYRTQNYARNRTYTRCGAKSAWVFQALFLKGYNANETNPEKKKCELIRCREHWEICLRWVMAAEKANEIINVGRAVPKTLLINDGPQVKAFGIIGYDTPLDVPQWAEDLFPKQKSWSDANFPRLTEDKKIQFGRSRQFCSTAEAVIAYVEQKAGPMFKKGKIFPYQLRDGLQTKIPTFLDESSTYVVALGAWENHARILFNDKANKILKVYDPWKQFITIPEWLSSSAKQKKYKVEFVRRQSEQQLAEGSCQLQATMRLLMASQLGENGITVEFDLENHPELGIYPVVTQLLYSKLRVRPKK